MKWIQEKIDKNRLPLTVDEYLRQLGSHAYKYPELDEYKLFYQYIVNQLYVDMFHYRLTTADDYVDGMIAAAGNVIRRAKLMGKNTTYYEFELADYEQWLQVRTYLYSKYRFDDPYDVAQLRLLNYFEMSCMNFIMDITTECKYEAVRVDWNTLEYDVWRRFNKTGFGVDVDSMSFIKYVKKLFNEGYVFKPVKP